MNIETRLETGVNVSQQLNLAPQLLQWLKLLQLPTLELCALIQQEVEVNPALEIADGDTPDSDAQRKEAGEEMSGSQESLEPEPTNFEDSDIGKKLEMLAEIDADWANDLNMRNDFAAGGEDADDKRRYMLESVTSGPSLHERIEAQIATARFSEQELRIAELIAGSLDRRGYLAATVDELAELSQAPREAVEKTLAEFQGFDPPGVAARSLSECLLLQIKDQSSLAARIIRECLEPLGRGQYREIAVLLGVPEEEVLEAKDMIVGLNPEPASVFNSRHADYITPDILITRGEDSGFKVEINDSRIPNVRVSARCRRMLESGSLSADDMAYLRKKIRGASFLVQGIGQRKQTLRKVAEEIVKRQSDYFNNCADRLNPLTMAVVAQAIGVHETTVSRALSGKYMETPMGIVEMKHFFRAGYKCEDGSEMVSDAVQDIIDGLIRDENPAQPLTDLEIVDILKAKGLSLARRTVAKYRSEMGIASSKDRAKTPSRAKLLRLRPVESATGGDSEVVEPAQALA